METLVGSDSANAFDDLPRGNLLESPSGGVLVFGEGDEIASDSSLSCGDTNAQLYVDGLDLSRAHNSNGILAENGNAEGELDHDPGHGSISIDNPQTHISLDNPQTHISTEACGTVSQMDDAKTGDPLTGWIPKKGGIGNESTRKVPTQNASSAINGPARAKPASKRRTFFMVKLPRNADAQLRSKIKLAELQLEEASKNKDIIRAALQLKRASKIGLLDKLKVKWEKERACKDAVQRKRVEIDPLQHALDQFKQAEELSREEDSLDKEIASLQHRIQHESIPLKEEKQLVRRIKNLESQRKEFFVNDVDHVQLLDSYGSKEVIEEQLDILQKELDVLRAEQSQARLECIPTEKELEDLNVKMDDLVEQLEKAKQAHGAAFGALKEVKRSLAKLNSDFYENKEDFRRARELASSHNVEELAVFCHQQVEGVLTCWNDDGSFRERYMKNNELSTIRRLETLDGRSLGPDEEPPLLTSDVDMNMEISMGNGPASKLGPDETMQKLGPADKKGKLQQAGKAAPGGSDSSQAAATMESKTSGGKIQNSKARGPPPSPVVVVVEPPQTVDTKEDAAAKAAQAAEAEEKRREEEQAREKEVAELKGKRRQEEIAKAREASERKKKQAERAQAKAQLRAQRELERKDKEREKKARKKAMAATEEPMETPPQVEERETDPVLEEPPPKELVKRSSSSRARGSVVKLTKRPQRQPIKVSATRIKSTWPFMSVWMWILLGVIIVTAVVIVFLANS